MREKIRIISIIIGFISIISLQSCNDEPTMMGSTLLYDTVSIFPISTLTHPLVSSLDSRWMDFNIRDRGVFHVGMFKDVKAFSILQFYETLRNIDSLDYLRNYKASQILSCKLKIPVDEYVLGDTNSMSFKIYNVTKDWPSDKSKLDYDEALGYLDMNRVIGEFTGNDPEGIITIDINKELILEWFNIWYKNKVLKDSSEITWGLALVPNNGVEAIRSFIGTVNTSSDYPYLEITYNDSLGVLDTLNIQEETDKSFYAVAPINPNELVVQGGVSTRGIIRFDITQIPYRSAIHEAQLELSINMEKSFSGNNGLDDVLRWELPSDISKYYNDALDTLIDRILMYDEGKKIEDKYYFYYVAPALEHINRNTGLGEIAIRNSSDQDEKRELDRLVFYGLDAPDSTKRPVLKIIYSKRPELKP